MRLNPTTTKILMFVVALIIIALILIAVVLNSGKSDDSPKKDVSGNSEDDIALISQTGALTNDLESSSVSVTIRGPVVARETHYQVTMTIDADLRVLKTQTGYDGTESKTKRYKNDSEAYRQFLGALERRGLDKPAKSDGATNIEGYCPAGELYTYEFDGPGRGFDRWSNSCDTIGTLSANGPSIRKLFRKQFVDYNERVEELNVIDYHFLFDDKD